MQQGKNENIGGINSLEEAITHYRKASSQAERERAGEKIYHFLDLECGVPSTDVYERKVVPYNDDVHGCEEGFDDAENEDESLDTCIDNIPPTFASAPFFS